MISAIVFVSGARCRTPSRDHELVVQSLAWLVSATVAGLVRDVVLAGRPGLGLAEIADQAGCGTVENPDEASCLEAALRLARGPRALLIESGFQPAETIIGELDGLARTMGPTETARLVTVPLTPWHRLLPNRAPIVGLFAPVDRALAVDKGDFRRLAARLKPGLRLASRAAPIL